MFTSTRLILIYLTIQTCQASRLFYLPLPKLYPHDHSQHHEEIVHHQPVQQQSDEEKIKEQEQQINEKRDAFQWESLVDDIGDAVKREHHKNDHLLPDDLTLNDDNGLKVNKLTPPIKEINHINNPDYPWIVDSKTEILARLQYGLAEEGKKKRRNDTVFLAIVATCSLVGVVGLVGAAVFWYRVQKRAEAAAEAEYPSYGVTGPSKDSRISPSSTMSDRKLAQSAQMYHYQQQRLQMMAKEKAHMDQKPVNSDESDDDTAGGDYTVYECPGLAPTGEMEVRNPLFNEPDPAAALSSSPHHSITNHHPQPISTTPPLSTSPIRGNDKIIS